MPKDTVSEVLTPEARVEMEMDQHYQYTLNEFAGLVERYGADKVLTDMQETAFWHLFKWFAEAFLQDADKS